MVGFNRRFSPHIIKVKQIFADHSPKAINYRINSGIVPIGHWLQDKDIGGGRIIGEVCHFIDLAMFIAGWPIKDVSANILNDGKNLSDTLVINLSFTDGSIANISYFSNGSKLLPKERLEVFSAGQTAIIDDFKSMQTFYKKGSTYNLSHQDKGHSAEIKAFSDAIKNAAPLPISFEEIYFSTLATFKVIESALNRRIIQI
jgi:polar amino acid transport system substrate-binding protein